MTQTLSLAAAGAFLTLVWGVSYYNTRKQSYARKYVFGALLVASLAAGAYCFKNEIASGVSTAAAAATRLKQNLPSTASQLQLQKSYNKMVRNATGSRDEVYGKNSALMQKQERIAQKLHAHNMRTDQEYARHTNQLAQMGVQPEVLPHMNTAIKSDLQQSTMADRNHNVAPASSFTAPAVVGQYNSGLDQETAVESQTGASVFSAVTGLTAETMKPGPKATAQEASKLHGNNADTIRAEAEAGGLMADADAAVADTDAIADVFSASNAVGVTENDELAQKYIADAIESSSR